MNFIRWPVRGLWISLSGWVIWTRADYFGIRSFGNRSIGPMAKPADPPRLPIGQLLINLLRLFRVELAARGEGAAGVEGIRPAHLQVFGVIEAEGTRLTGLAERSGLSLSAMSELVDGLQGLGYLARRPDPKDGRAKLVCLTEPGWEAVREGRRLIAQIEADWAQTMGGDQFEQLCQGLQVLVDELDPGVRERYVARS
jgi:DNA-binding MarR family transcriptional regulator